MGEIGLAGAVALLGWLLSVPLGLIARRLDAERVDGTPPRGLGLLAADPPLQAFQALALAALAVRFGLGAPLAIYGALSLVFTIVFFIDLRTGFVYRLI